MEHPAGKLLVQLSQQQDKEVGEGTTSVVLFTAELLRLANELTKSRVHPITIINGYKTASREAIRFIVENMSQKVDIQDRSCLLNVAKTSMSSKIIGSSSDIFSEIVVDAALSVTKTISKSKTKCAIEKIKVLKAHGQSHDMSQFVKGYVLNCTVASQDMKPHIKNASIACLDVSLQRVRLNMGVSIVIDDPEKLEAIRKREVTITIERLKSILKSGANVILTTKGIDDMCMKIIIDAGAIAVRRVDRSDIISVAGLTGASLITTFADLDGQESFDSSNLGHADEVYLQTIADGEYIFIKGQKASSLASIILRGANESMLDEMERSIHDALSAVKRALETKYVVAGGGAVETAVSVYLENLAISFSSREQLAIAEYASALLVIPSTLATNSAFDSTKLVSKLIAHHGRTQSDNSAPCSDYNFGLNLFEGTIRDNFKAGVLEPSMTKLNFIKAATEAAIALLRIDDMIKITPPPNPEDPHAY